jgi:protein-disulfide isomerase
MTETTPSKAGPGWPVVVLAFVAGASIGALGWREYASANASDAAAGPAFQKQVRDAILADPEIVPDAINLLQAREVEKLLASNREAIETPFRGAWAGAADADVVLVEFFDFNCPFCRQGAADVERLLKEDPKLKVVWRDFPVLGAASDRFAMASLSAATQGKYRAFLQAAFSQPGRLTDQKLIPAVRAARLDEAQVARDLNSADYRRELDSNLALGRALGLTGTPSYIIGNEIISGAAGYEALKKAVAKARAAKTPKAVVAG